MKSRLKILLVMMVGVFLMAPLSSIAQEKTDEFKAKKFIRGKDTLNYRILYPENFSEDKNYPLVLFLHGAGERGDDNKAQLVHGSELFLKEENRQKYPAIVIFPQCPKDDYLANVEVDRSEFPLKFDFHFEEGPTKAMSMVMKLMDSVAEKSFIDKDRIYLGGLSMGGMGTFELLARKPETFAAAIAICGAADTETAEKYRKNLPIGIFHGLQDNVVSPNYSKQMTAAINENEGNASLRLYKGANHNSWDRAFAQCDLLDWLFSYSLNEEKFENEK
ncbi:phospholipase [Christiangramia fulva]|uniref:Phospholipase n=1 Tax=Christiangramia fulva TaxID=2126553 RepID=A0A2R3Z5F8_9FLAO|nr:prolyl oligopeptidase family serine peptidase [Christiangramia fulva]AVR45516.1 phospholipase [Christiangramia fulva]